MDNTKERPIIFNAQEVNAVLAGNKTHYRVPVLTSEQVAAGYKCCYGVASGQVIFTKDESDKSFVEDGYINVECALGGIGDRLWVQEQHYRHPDERYLLTTKPHYFADGHLTLADRHDAGLLDMYEAKDMPRWASRLLLEITDIRIERVQDISESDAIAEGIKYIHADPKDRVGPNHFTKSNGWYHCSRPTAAEVFTEMYKVSDDYEEYGENPWVWVIEFKEIKESNDG